MQQLIGNFRTMVLFRGIVAILFGIVTLIWPGLTISALVLLFGIFAILNGITATAAALRAIGLKSWILLLIEGILSILAGAIALVWPGITALAFLYILSAWAIITGIVEVLAPLAFPMRGGHAVLTVLAGLISIVFGVLIAEQPASGLLSIIWLLGIYAIVFGITYIVLYFQSHSLEQIEQSLA